MTTITITIPDELDATHTRFQTENGTTWADAYVEAKLREIQGRHVLEDAVAFKETFDRLPVDQKATITAQLEAVAVAVVEVVAEGSPP